MSETHLRGITPSDQFIVDATSGEIVGVQRGGVESRFLPGADLAAELAAMGYSPFKTQSQLKKWRAALAKVQSGAANARIAFFGDSTDTGMYATGSAYAGNRPLTVSNFVAKLFEGIGINANVGSQFGDSRIGNPFSQFTSYDTRWTFGAGWIANNIIRVVGGSMLSNISDNTAAHFQPKDSSGANLVFDTIKVTYMKKSTYGNFTIGVDSGAALFTSAQAGTGALDTVTVTTTLAAHVVDIAKTVNDATQLHINSIECYDSTRSQVFCQNWGEAGYLAADLAYNPNYQNNLNGLAYYAPDLTIINCVINDANSKTNPAAYKASLQSVITTALVSGSVVLRTGNPTQVGFGGYTANQADPYIAACYALAVENDIPIVDTYGRFVSWDEMNALGFISNQQHPVKSGYQDVANALWSVIKPQY